MKMTIENKLQLLDILTTTLKYYPCPVSDLAKIIIEDKIAAIIKSLE